MYTRSLVRHSFALVVLGLTCLTVSRTPTQAQTTLDFENLSNTGSGLINQGRTISQNGFTITTTNSNGLFSIAPGSAGLNYTGSVALYNAASGPGSFTTITQDNGAPFTLNSIDVANAFSQGVVPGGAHLVFNGIVLGGGLVPRMCAVEADDNTITATFGSEFTNLTSVIIFQGSVPNQFDNIRINFPTNAVPEPDSVALLVGLFVTGAGFVRKRRNRS